MQQRGKYIVIEGNDGTGKSTQIELLADWLKKTKGTESFVVHEPAGTPISDALRDIIKNGMLEREPETNLLLFTAARHEIWQQAKQALSEGKWVLSARNYLSTLVFQGYAEGLSVDLIKQTTKTFTDEQYMNPDFTIILELNEVERNKRIESRGTTVKDTFESKDHSFQSKINDGFKQIADKYGYPTINADQSIEAIQLEIQALLG